jgi:hypothetical protein
MQSDAIPCFVISWFFDCAQNKSWCVKKQGETVGLDNETTRGASRPPRTTSAASRSCFPFVSLPYGTTVRRT